MEAKFTPGPWYGRPSHDPVLIQGCDVADLSLAFACGGGDPRRSEYIANARLIAAAPDMLEVLQRIYSFGELSGEDYDAVREVIAKATGGEE